MKEERKMILEMLSEKKITAEEAAELLRALGGGEAGQRAQEPAQPAGRASASQDDYERDEGATIRFRPQPASGSGRSILEDFLGRLDVDWSNLPFAFGGEGYRFEEEHKGEFTATGTIRLELTGRNGRVEIFGWDQPGWRVILRKKIRAQNEERARERAAEIVRFESGPGHLRCQEQPMGWGNSGVSVEVHVPKDRTYDIVAHSSNGRVLVEGLRCLTLNGKTANGKVGIRNVMTREADLSTANGGITFEGSAERLECDTANGTITCCPQAKANMSCRLHTSNGSIRVRTPEGAGVGYRIDAHTSHGGIDVGLSGFDIQEQEKQFGRRSLRGQSGGYDAKPVKVAISARTTNGSIRFTPGIADEDC